MDGFFEYNQIQIRKEDHYKTAFTTPWGTFSYRVIPFSINKAGATFHHTITYYFSDLVHIMLVYLDNFIAQSRKQAQHIDDLRQTFLRCCKYRIRLNPFKCVFCIPMGRLLGFIVSHKGTTVYPLEIQTTFPITSPL